MLDRWLRHDVGGPPVVPTAERHSCGARCITWSCGPSTAGGRTFGDPEHRAITPGSSSPTQGSASRSTHVPPVKRTSLVRRCSSARSATVARLTSRVALVVDGLEDQRDGAGGAVCSSSGGEQSRGPPPCAATPRSGRWRARRRRCGTQPGRRRWRWRRPQVSRAEPYRRPSRLARRRRRDGQRRVSASRAGLTPGPFRRPCGPR